MHDPRLMLPALAILGFFPSFPLPVEPRGRYNRTEEMNAATRERRSDHRRQREARKNARNR